MIEIKIEKLIDKLIIVGKDVDFLEIEEKVTEAILRAVNTAGSIANEVKDSDQDIEE